MKIMNLKERKLITLQVQDLSFAHRLSPGFRSDLIDSPG